MGRKTSEGVSLAASVLGKLALLAACVGCGFMVGTVAFALAAVPGAEPVAGLFGLIALACYGFAALVGASLFIRGWR